MSALKRQTTSDGGFFSRTVPLVSLDLNACAEEDTEDGLMGMSVASVSKGDIEHLENKIKVLEKQISKIKHKHD